MNWKQRKRHLVFGVVRDHPMLTRPKIVKLCVERGVERGWPLPVTQISVHAALFELIRSGDIERIEGGRVFDPVLYVLTAEAELRSFLAAREKLSHVER